MCTRAFEGGEPGVGTFNKARKIHPEWNEGLIGIEWNNEHKSTWLILYIHVHVAMYKYIHVLTIASSAVCRFL